MITVMVVDVWKLTFLLLMAFLLK
uniref:Uncharacterized protein n=1 Tax=Rhizophora mucronata TaxID=61149 RepID=A0A2P2J0I1_RHIMU